MARAFVCLVAVLSLAWPRPGPAPAPFSWRDSVVVHTGTAVTQGGVVSGCAVPGRSGRHVHGIYSASRRQLYRALTTGGTVESVAVTYTVTAFKLIDKPMACQPRAEPEFAHDRRA